MCYFISLSIYSFTNCNVHVQKQSQGVNCNGANIYSTIPCIRARRDTQETPPMKMSHGRSFIFEIMPEILTRNMTMLAVEKKNSVSSFYPFLLFFLELTFLDALASLGSMLESH